MRTVMIVDDERHVIQGLLEHIPWSELGMEVTAAAQDGEEALEKVRRVRPDLVITDIYMPKMDGLTLIKHLREEFPDIQIVINSGYDEFDNARIAMSYGVQYFLLKPSMVSEICSVLRELVQEMEVQEKNKKLLETFEENQQSYLLYMKDSFIRELLTTRYRPDDIPSEKLAMLNWSKDMCVAAASLTLIRPPYLTKSREREWQLMKFSSGNIIQEILLEERERNQVEIHAVDYSDLSYVIVFLSKNAETDLLEIGKQIAGRIIDHILMYLKLSVTAGIGEVKRGVHELISSYLESQKALEAADYHAVNRVYTYQEVHGQEPEINLPSPYGLLRDIYCAIDEREPHRIPEIWRSFEEEVLSDHHLPLFITQNVCISLIGILTTEIRREQEMKQHMERISRWYQEIRAQGSTRDLCAWMRRWLDEWQKQECERWAGKKSNHLVEQVKEYVRHHYDQEITLTEIADSLYVNRSYLSQLFKRVTGETFVTYLNRFRIEKAKERMREKHYLISEISEMVGYQNPTYFSQVFKSITGKSPSEYYK